MVELVFFLDAAQNRDRVLDRRLGDEHRLEAPCQSGILFHVLAVVVQRRRADAVQLAPGQGRLQQVRRVHRALGRAGANDGVHLVDEHDDFAIGRRDFGQHRLQAFLELTPELGPGDQRPQVERHQALSSKVFRHVAPHDAHRQPLDDGGLADARFADEDRVVLGAAGQNLNGPSDFLIAADNGIDLTVAGGVGQVAGVFFQRLVVVLGVAVIRGPALAELNDRLVQRLNRHPGIGDRLGSGRAGGHGYRQQQLLGGDEAVARFLGDFHGLLKQPRRFRGQVRLRGAGAFDLRQFLEFGLGVDERLLGVAAGGVDEFIRQAVGILEKTFQEMQRCQLLMIGAQRQGLGRLNEAARARGEVVEFHASKTLAVTVFPAPFKGGPWESLSG